MKKIFVFFLLLPGCGGSLHKKKDLANNHFRQASLEVREYQEKNDPNFLRKALNEIDKSIELQPTPHNLGLKGTILLQLGTLDQDENKIKESLKYFERIINNKQASKARRADAQNNYATALYQVGRTEEAEKNWHGLTINPHYISPEVAYFNLGYAQLNEALRSNNQNPQANKEIFKQHLEQAITYFRQALAISKEYIDALFFIARALIGLTRYEEARDAVITILTINPQHTPAKEFLRRIEAYLTNHH